MRRAVKEGFTMFSNPSLIILIAIGKGVGFFLGLVAFVFLPFFLPDAS